MNGTIVRKVEPKQGRGSGGPPTMVEEKLTAIKPAPIRLEADMIATKGVETFVVVSTASINAPRMRPPKPPPDPWADSDDDADGMGAMVRAPPLLPPTPFFTANQRHFLPPTKRR